MNNQLNKKNVIIIIIFVIFAILLSIFGFKYYNFQKNNSEIITGEGVEDEGVKGGENEDEEGDEISDNLPTKEDRLVDSGNFTLAVEGGEIERCDEIGNTRTKNLCYKRVADINNDVSYCERLPQDDQVTCKMTVFKNLAKKEKNLDPCLGLKEDLLIKKCMESVIKDNYCESEECINEFQENKEDYDTDGDGILDDMETYIYKTDSDNSDTDGDGLSDYDEIFKHKTNPRLPDTDGDGYGDGVEVKSGYDPLN